MTNSTSITIKNFKSYQDATLPLAPLTLLIGANASGKSNVIEAFRFLSWVAGGERLSTLKNRVNDSDKVVRGSVRDLAFNDEDSFSLSFHYSGGDYSGIFLNDGGRLKLISEIYKESDNTIVFYRTKNHTNFLVKYLDELFFKNIYKLSFLKDNWSFHQIGKTQVAMNFPEEDLSFLSMRDLYRTFFNGFYDQTKLHDISIIPLDYLSHFLTLSFFFDFIPNNMRVDSFIDSDLRADGSNLAGVLYHICENISLKTKLLALVKSLPEQDIIDIKLYKDHRGRIEFSLIENFGNKSVERTMDLLSDGTLKVLGIATALLSVPQGSTIVIEEIDNSIHPTRAYDILNLMRQYADERQLKLLLSTHNPALMDALPDEALADVVFCYRDPQQGDSRLIRLGDLEDYLGLVSQGSLGELVSKGVVERFVKHPTTPQQRKQQALDWLNQLQEAE